MMENKIDERVVEDISSSFNPNPHSQLTTLTSVTNASIMDMTSAYGQPPVTSYAHDVSGAQYYAEYDWSQQQGQSLNGLAVDPTSCHAYLHNFSDRPDLMGAPSGSMPLGYPGFPSIAPGAPTDMYGPASTLWSHHHHHHHPHHPPPPPMGVDDPHHMPLTSRYMPAMARSSSSASGSSSSGGKPKRRRVQTQPQRKAANIRERRRMYHLNTAFDELRKRLPAFNYEKRLSRIETLRLAMTYIGFMKDVTLGEDPRKIKLRTGNFSDTGSDLSHVDLESCASDDHNDDLDS